MTAQDVIADCLKQLRRPGARTTDAGDAAFVTAALAAAGIGTLDTRTHAAVPRGLAGWMPIETAPRDGQRVFVYWPHWYSTPIIASCLGDYETWLSEMVLTGDGPGPTHWFPLPDPPAAEAEAKETGDE